MAAEETTNQEGNIKLQFNAAQLGLNMDSSVAQVKKGMLTYALNAALENFDANSVSYQNEPGNELCVNFPVNYVLIGKYFIPEKNKHVFFLVSPGNNKSQIGYMINNDCVYRPLLTLDCLNFNVNHPVHKVAHKITNCTEEIYWTDGLNPRRYLDLAGEMPTDCNLLKIQPNFNIPQLAVNSVVGGGQLTAGTYQFAIQYSNANGIGYTSYYSVTNPLPIANVNNVETLQFDYIVNRSIEVNISNIDTSGYYQYYNLAVIQTVNDITSVELIGTYFIDATTNSITYTGQNQTQIRLSLNDVIEKFPYYDVAQDVTSVQDILVWDNLTSDKRVSYQKIANQITTQWETYRIPATENYSDALNAANLRGYLRDEVYAFEIVFLLKNGKQTDGFHIPGRASVPSDLTLIADTNPDYIESTPTAPRWKIYNTASFTGYSPEQVTSPSYKGPWNYGEFAYWESKDEKYPPNVDVWGSLAGQKIRHHKFPDVLVSPLFESAPLVQQSGVYTNIQMNATTGIFPIGVRVSAIQVQTLINQAVAINDLTQEEADEIVGFKIVRGDRSTNKSIVGKGILRNVGTYNRGKAINGNGAVVSEGTNYYLPNYPYNDVREDPFLNTQSNGNNANSVLWYFQYTGAGDVSYTDPFTGETLTKSYPAASSPANKVSLCSLTVPISITPGFTIGDPLNVISGLYVSDPDPSVSPTKGYSFRLTCLEPGTFTSFAYTDTLSYRLNPSAVATIVNVQYGYPVVVNAIAVPTKSLTAPTGSNKYSIQYDDTTNPYCLPAGLNAFADTNILDPNSSKYRMVFNSPETSFAKPTLGNILKLESVIFGAGQAHFKEVEKNAEYKLITKAAQQQALDSSYDLASGTTFDTAAFFAAYQTYLSILIAGISRQNFGYSFNSIANYDYSANIPNSGQKQRILDKYQYLIPGVQSVSDLYNVNNFQRESSVYLKTVTTKPFLVFPSNSSSIKPGATSLVSDNSRFTLSQVNTCAAPETLKDINVVSYYGSIKNQNVNQYGQIYSYETVDTGFQIDFDLQPLSSRYIVFGGDTFISKFAFKTKLPFFIDNTVGAPNDADIFYDEIGNVAYPKFWHSSNSITSTAYVPSTSYPSQKEFPNIISVKTRNFDCPNFPTVVSNSLANIDKNFTNYSGKFYMFAYGIPYFYCESGINIDLRQAFNNKEGDFFPRVSTSIPDQWLQESYVSINNDNTYHYNVSYSKQNTENFFSHLPINFDRTNNCYTYYPFRAIYSDSQISDPTGEVNNWLTYRATSFFDFPQNYGDLVSLDGIQNKAVLARFENKSLLYNTMLTIDTSNPQAAYIGNSTLFKSAPPIDFAETNLGYVGSQNKFLLKIPQGQVTVDAKRGQIFLITNNGAEDLTAFGSGVNRFMTDHLAFEILRYFPEVDIDNNFNGVGLHGVFDSKFDRIIFTKLDYIPQPAYVGVIKYGNDPAYPNTYKKYYTGTQQSPTIVNLLNPTYFCNKSWTISFNLNTKSWVSFHTYLPNYYIGENNFFYSGLSDGCGLTFIAASSIVGNCTMAGFASLNTAGCIFQGNAVTVPPPQTYCALDGFAAFIIGACTFDGNALSIPFSTTTTTTTAAPNCVIEGVAVPQGFCVLEGNAVSVYEPSTTTTTTSSTSTTTTTTTQYVPVCTLEGVASIDNFCILDGDAIIMPPQTTTTTTSTSTTTTTTTTPPPACITWYFNNSGDPGDPIENWTYTNCDNVPNNTISAEVGLPNSACVRGGTTPSVGSLGDNPFTANEPCTNPGTVSVTITPLNSLNTSSYTPFINGVADPSWDSGTRTYSVGTLIRVDYSNPACSVTLNTVAYNSGTTINLASGNSYAFELKNADNFVNNGNPTCQNNALVQPIINDCGTTSFTVIDDCSCQCNVTCDGVYWGPWYCDGTGFGSTSKRNQFYFCNNLPTGVVETSPNCTTACGATETVESCNGTTTLTRTLRYVCDRSIISTETFTCSAACGTNYNQTQGGQIGTYHTCSQGTVTSTPVYINNNPCYTGGNIYLVNGSWQSSNPSNSYPNTAPTWEATNTFTCYGTCNKYMRYLDTNQCSPTWNQFKPQDSADIVQFDSTFCGGCCGQSTAQNWVNSGNYSCYGTCNKYNIEVQSNPCASGYQDTRQGSLVNPNDPFCGGCCGQPTGQIQGGVIGYYHYCGGANCLQTPVYINSNPCYTGTQIYQYLGTWSDQNFSNNYSDVCPCCSIWNFSNSGDIGDPDETWTYLNCAGQSSSITLSPKQVDSRCVLNGTTPSIGSLGDNPFPTGVHCS